LTSGVPRSQRLLAFSFTEAGNSPAFQCPADHVTLVKGVAGVNQSATAARFSVVLVVEATNVTVSVSVREIPTATDFAFDFWVVLNPGDLVFVQTDVAPATVWLSGAVLRGGPQFPPAELADPLVWPPAPAPLPAAG